MDHRISMIAAIGKNRELGKGNDLLWKIPVDLKRFRETTKGHPIIMGRKTFESIGKPLPNRTNIVITRDGKWAAEGAFPVISMEEAIELAKIKPGNDEIFVIGGGQIYDLGLRYADKLYLTLIEDAKEADSFFPEYEHVFKQKKFIGDGDFNGVKYTWMDFER
ncbi:MAG: dihydrofolate reductase [Minisyncoccia bacterium]